MESTPPPHSIDYERCVLGAALLRDVHCITVLDELRLEDFYAGSHQLVYSTIKDMHEAGRAVELLTVMGALEDAKLLEQAGGYEALNRCQELAAGAVQLNEHIRQLQRYSALRKFGNLAYEIGRLAADPGADPMDLADLVNETMGEIGDAAGPSAMLGMADVMDATEASMRRASTGFGHGAVPSGISMLDHYTNGWHGGELIVVGARPSMGKSAFALNIAHNSAVRNLPVLFFSLEMSEPELGKRLVSMNGGHDSVGVRSGNVDWTRVSPTLLRLKGLQLYIDATAGLRPRQIRDRVRRMMGKVKVAAIVIDYLQLMTPDTTGGRGDVPREQQIASMTRTLKCMARDFDLPVIVLSQLNRQLEGRSGAKRRPMLSDLRESGAIEQDADVVMFVHREHVYDETADPCEAEVIIAKQRNGPIGTIPLTWIDTMQLFLGRDDDDATAQVRQPPQQRRESRPTYASMTGRDDFDDREEF